MVEVSGDWRLRRANELRLGLEGSLTPEADFLVRTLLLEARNPKASSELGLWTDPDTGARAYTADGQPFSLITESLPWEQRAARRMRRAVWPQIQQWRDGEFSAGRGFSALSGVPLSIESCHVDHEPPRRFRDLASDYLWLDGMTHPDSWQDMDDWTDFHQRYARLRLLTPTENLRQG